MANKISRLSYLAAAVVVVLLILATAGFYWRTAIAAQVGQLLVRDDRGVHPEEALAPYAMLLMGDGGPTRADAAVNLYRRGQIKKIIMAREQADGFIKLGLQRSYSDTHQDYLLREGVAGSDVVYLDTCVATSTRDEADCALGYLTTLTSPPPRLVLVTSWYHTSRASWQFERRFAAKWPGTPPTIVAVPAYPSPNVPWWTDEGSFLSVFNEYLKWLYWLSHSRR